ncbi:hypothetical protein NPIL_160611 [Nephila pilipes]|uniref:Uncharacterized protein n=1 Tax=Nephila pilipes TaxID=299642 RepID=A0A8X6N3J7_NEPPI|nr:hypothetical protein NPIL_160611 [Nephila pilipes]
MCFPSLRSKNIRRDTTPFTTLSNISCCIADAYWTLTSLNVDNNLSRYTFDFKTSQNQESYVCRHTRRPEEPRVWKEFTDDVIIPNLIEKGFEQT